MKQLVKVAMALTFMILVVNVASAQRGTGKGNNQGYKNGSGTAMTQSLKLTEDQQTQMRSLRLNMQKEMLPIRNEIGENRAKLRTLTTAEHADMKAINELIDSNSELMARMWKLRAANHQQVRKILTEEQRIIFDSRQFQRQGRKMPGQKGAGRPHEACKDKRQGR
jgi:periplasmic protein CpxP/Spy